MIQAIQPSRTDSVVVGEDMSDGEVVFFERDWGARVVVRRLTAEIFEELQGPIFVARVPAEGGSATFALVSRDEIEPARPN